MSDGTRTSTPSDEASGSGSVHPVRGEPEVRLRLPAVPANVALVRQALAGLAEGLGVEAAHAADMKVAITEACANAILHADDGDELAAPLEVTMAAERGCFVLTVLMTHEQWPTEAIVLELARGAPVSAVLGRVVALVAARADFSIDRLSDTQLVCDALAGTACAQTALGSLCVAIDEHPHGFDLAIGPLVAGGGRRLINATELPGLGCLLERLADELAVERVHEPRAGERLRARFDVRD